jgi:hypothetical protein
MTFYVGPQLVYATFSLNIRFYDALYFFDLNAAAIALSADPFLNQLIWLSLNVWFT